MTINRSDGILTIIVGAAIFFASILFRPIGGGLSVSFYVVLAIAILLLLLGLVIIVVKSIKNT